MFFMKIYYRYLFVARAATGFSFPTEIASQFCLAKRRQKRVTVPACHNGSPFLQLATRQGDIFQSESSCEQDIKL
jgi:hypothetical protein